MNQNQWEAHVARPLAWVSSFGTVAFYIPMQNFMLNQPYSMYDFGWCNLEMDAWINHEMDTWVNLN